MQAIQFAQGYPPELANAENVSEDTTVFLWLDIERSEIDWYDKAQPWLKIRSHDISAVFLLMNLLAAFLK